MENASKALIMAGGIFVGVIMLSIFSYLYTSARGLAARYEINAESQKQITFNQQFTQYEGNDLTPHDVVTIINLVKKVYESDGVEITISVPGITSDYILNDQKSDELKKQETNLIKNGYQENGNDVKIQYYKIDSIEKSGNVVSKIVIKKK